nr:50S ribosomal protein L18P [uncultured archaeon]
MQFNRKIHGRTDYRKRLSLVKSRLPRLVVRKSLKNTLAQIIEFHENGDKIILSASTKELEKKYGLKASKKNIPSAYLLGILVGKKALAKGIKKVILDIGLYRNIKGSRLYAVLKGSIDAGLDIPHSKEVLPSQDRLEGKHILDYYQKAKKEYNIPDLGKHINEIKAKIIK